MAGANGTAQALVGATADVAGPPWAAVLRLCPLPACVTADDGPYLDANDHFLALTGYAREELVGRTPAELGLWGRSAEDAVVAAALAAAGELRDQATALTTKRGARLKVLASAGRVPGKAGAWLSVLTDITAREDAEERVRASEARFRALAANASDLVTVLAADGTVLYESPSVERVLGHRPDDLIGRDTFTLVHPDDRPAVAAAFAAAVADPAAAARTTATYRYRHADGSWRWLESTGSNLLADPAVGGIVLNTRDVTERRAAEAALREESEALATINRIGRLLTAELDRAKLVQAVTDAATELTGAAFGAFFLNAADGCGEYYAPHTLSGAPRAAFAGLPPPCATALFGPTFRGEGVVRLADVRQDHRFGWTALHRGLPPGHAPVVSYLAVPVVSRSGAVLGGLVFGHPDAAAFTERHERLAVGLAAQAAVALDNALLYEAAQANEARLAAERDLLDALLENIPDTVYFKDTEARFVRIGRGCAALLGVADPGEAIGRSDADFFSPHMAAGFLADDRRVLDTGEPVVNRVELHVDDGPRSKWGLTTKVPLRDGAGRVVGLVGVGRDITGLKRLEAELRAAMEAAEEASRLKSVFLSTVTHELRTPLTSIQGYLELMLDGEAGELPAEAAEFARVVHDNARRLTTLINDVLDLAKIDAGRMEVHPTAVEAARLVAEVRAVLAPQAAKKGLGFAVAVSDGMPPLWCDPHRTHQILVNLVGNAVKFTDAGGVTVSAQATGDGWVELAVADTGVGIPVSALGEIFDEYRQADASATRRHGGSGLGLAIAKKLAELQGGAIAVESLLGAGSTFTLRLPTLEDRAF